MIRNLGIHIHDIVKSRNIRFAFYRFLAILNRRIQLPKGIFIGRELLTDELVLEKHIDVSKKIVFLDIGAKTGLWSKKLAKKCKKIHSFEPNPETVTLLKKNTRKLKNLTIYQCAIGDKNEIKEFLINKRLEACGFVKRLDEYEGTINVPVRTIDSFNFEEVDLIKIDTEGYELPIIKGGLKTIKSKKPQLYIEIHELDQLTPILVMIQEIGYTYELHYMDRVFPQPIIITNPHASRGGQL